MPKARTHCGAVALAAGLLLTCGPPRLDRIDQKPVRSSTTTAGSPARLTFTTDANRGSACIEPHSITRLDPHSASKALLSDPLPAPTTWRSAPCCEPGTSSTVRDGNRTFTQGGLDNTLVVEEGGEELWRSTFGLVAGGFVTVLLSPHGTLVRREYSRGGVELFAAESGLLLANLGHGVQVAPNESFALDPPSFEGADPSFNRAEVLKHDLVPKRAPKAVVRLPLPVGSPVEDGRLSSSSFGVAIGPTSTLYAVSFPSTELGVYRSSDDTKLARFDNPLPGVPQFSKSGCLIAVSGDGDEAPTVFRLAP